MRERHTGCCLAVVLPGSGMLSLGAELELIWSGGNESQVRAKVAGRSCAARLHTGHRTHTCTRHSEPGGPEHGPEQTPVRRASKILGKWNGTIGILVRMLFVLILVVGRRCARRLLRARRARSRARARGATTKGPPMGHPWGHPTSGLPARIQPNWTSPPTELEFPPPAPMSPRQR